MSDFSHYDENNNCVICDQYIYDQHKKSCKHYVEESYSTFLKRIQDDTKGYELKGVTE